MAKTPMKKSVKKAAPGVRKRKGKQTFNSYIFKVLKQVHPQTRISKKGIMIVSNFGTDTFDRVRGLGSKSRRLHNPKPRRS